MQGGGMTKVLGQVCSNNDCRVVVRDFRRQHFIFDLRPRTFAVFLFGLLASLTLQTLAASFDCAKASTAIEKSICQDADLSVLDEELENAYRKAIQNPSIEKALQVQQRAWIQVVRNRIANPFYLKQIYRERIEQLASESPLVAVPSGDFSCEMKISNEDEEKIEARNLNFQIQNGKLTRFTWWATLAPKSPDLRPSFHYRTDMSLSEMNIVEVSGYLALQSRPIPGLSDQLQENCDVILTKHGSKLHVYTVGCESRPETSHFDYQFNQTNATCRLENANR
jgi:uncharacterized protein